MGGPTSAIVSEIYIQSLETTAITTADHPPKVWERYVDDIFSIVNKTYLQELLEHIPKHNSQKTLSNMKGNFRILLVTANTTYTTFDVVYTKIMLYTEQILFSQSD